MDKRGEKKKARPRQFKVLYPMYLIAKCHSKDMSSLSNGSIECINLSTLPYPHAEQ